MPARFSLRSSPRLKSGASTPTKSLGLAAHRQFFHREPGIEALRLHFRAADADDLKSGNLPAQRGDKMSSEKIPRGLPGHHAYDDGIALHQRLANDAPLRALEKLDEHLELRRLRGLARDLAPRFLEREAGPVERLVGA